MRPALVLLLPCPYAKQTSGFPSAATASMCTLNTLSTCSSSLVFCASYAACLPPAPAAEHRTLPTRAAGGTWRRCTTPTSTPWSILEGAACGARWQRFSECLVLRSQHPRDGPAELIDCAS